MKRALLAGAAAALISAPAQSEDLPNGWVTAHQVGYCSVAKWPDAKGPGLIVTVKRRENLRGWIILISPEFGPIATGAAVPTALDFGTGRIFEFVADTGMDEGQALVTVYPDIEPLIDAMPDGFTVKASPQNAPPATIDGTGARAAFQELKDCAQKLD